MCSNSFRRFRGIYKDFWLNFYHFWLVSGYVQIWGRRSYRTKMGGQVVLINFFPLQKYQEQLKNVTFLKISKKFNIYFFNFPKKKKKLKMKNLKKKF